MAEPPWLTVVVVAALVPLASLAGALVPWGPSLAFFATIGGRHVGRAARAATEFVTDDRALVALVALLLGAAGAVLAIHYGAAVVVLTAGIPAMLDLGHPGSLELLDEGIVNTLIGAAVAVLALLLWPRPGAPAPWRPAIRRRPGDPSRTRPSPTVDRVSPTGPRAA